MGVASKIETQSPTAFSMIGAQLLSEGQTMDLVARSSLLWAHIKIYANGGENGLHFHPQEDHLFFVVAGTADFCDGNGNQYKIKPFEGILIPSGCLYKFASSSEENLVMLRVGTSADPELRSATEDLGDLELPAASALRVNANGTMSKPGDEQNGTGTGPGVPAPGQLFHQ